jgi:transcriptional regulator with XRE-family HTH domain
MKVNVNVGERIREYRKKRKLTQKELGKLIECDAGTISLYERGKFNPAAHIIIALADALEITTDELLREGSLSHAKSFLKDEELLFILTKLDDLPLKNRTTIKNLLKLLVNNNNSIS